MTRAPIAMILGTVLSCVVVSAHAQPKPPDAPTRKWVCEAKNIADYTYDGGDYATVRLAQYGRGSRYRVKKNSAGDTASGETGDGTPFTCTLK